MSEERAISIDEAVCEGGETSYVQQKRPPSPPPEADEPEQLPPGKDSKEESSDPEEHNVSSPEKPDSDDAMPDSGKGHDAKQADSDDTMPESTSPAEDEAPVPPPPAQADTPGLALTTRTLASDTQVEEEGPEKALIQALSISREDGQDEEDEEALNLDDMHFRIGGLFNLVVDEQRQRAVKRLVWYGLHLGLYCVLCFWSLPDGWAIQQALLPHFSSGTPTSMFDSIRSADDAWQWVEQKVFPLLEAANADGTQSFFVGEYNRLLGPVRLRQARVTSQPCWDDANSFFFPLDAKGLDGHRCWPDFSSALQDVSILNERLGKLVVKNSSEMFSENLLPWSGDPEEGTRYGTKAQVLDLALNCTGTQSCQDWQSIRKSFLVDQATRALSIEMRFYNANTDMVAHLRFQMDFSASGFVYPTAELSTMPLRPYNLPRMQLYLRLACDLFFVLGVAKMFLTELVGLARQRLTYFALGSNLLSLIRVSIYSLTGFLWVSFVFEDKSALEQLQAEFVDAGGIAARFEMLRCLASAGVIVGFLNFLRFLKVDEFLSILWSTLRETAVQIFWIWLAILCMACGYALAGHLAFGTHLEAFRSFRASCGSLLELTVGTSTVFDQVHAGRAGASVVLFVFGWNFIVCLLLTNAIPALLVSTYATVTARVRCLNVWRLQDFEVLHSWASKPFHLGPKSEAQIDLSEALKEDSRFREAHDAVKSIAKHKLNSRFLRQRLRYLLREDGTEVALNITEKQGAPNGDGKQSQHQPALDIDDIRALCKSQHSRTVKRCLRSAKANGPEASAQEIAKRLAAYVSYRQAADETEQIPDELRDALGLAEDKSWETKLYSQHPSARVGLDAVQDVKEMLKGLQKEVSIAEADIRKCLGISDLVAKASPS